MEFQFSLNNIGEIATRFWKLQNDSSVFAFHGLMGAGKTTFIHALCEAKGVKDTVGSPTFSLINQYNYTEGGEIKKIYHLDLYRLKDEDEAIQAGLEDCLYSGDVCLVEWPEKAPGIFPGNTAHLYIEVIDSDNRRLWVGDK
ncbi:MAG: tRNA (adenosine(37)-N6)-threonylcarbamoyltransferase complex ATPase subunit type 1 TsaE [Chitinophagaceae bacterium]|nr:tRNA (adenosine(37)-N6)-threonylcarbamoyltransferase complex ATPase subunit type 1 TsaE [Chitinophagaceae bacterium]